MIGEKRSERRPVSIDSSADKISYCSRPSVSSPQREGRNSLSVLLQRIVSPFVRWLITCLSYTLSLHLELTVNHPRCSSLQTSHVSSFRELFFSTSSRLWFSPMFHRWIIEHECACEPCEKTLSPNAKHVSFIVVLHQCVGSVKLCNY